jgi:hypothetical protein
MLVQSACQLIYTEEENEAALKSLVTQLQE